MPSEQRKNHHDDNSNFNWQYALDENGNQFASRIDGDPDFTEHDVLTGSQLDGTAFPPGEDQTCSNWTSNGEGSARVGHGDRYSFTTPGCSQEALASVGGAGLLLLFCHRLIGRDPGHAIVWPAAAQTMRACR